MLSKRLFGLFHLIVSLTIAFLVTGFFSSIFVQASPITNAFINEIHYDNDGSDINEFVEIAGDSNLNLTGWSLHLYNGNNGKEYKSFNLNSWSYIDASTNFGFLTIETQGLQNGSPDGIALFNGSDIIQFLSYEGDFIAQSGVAAGLQSEDIGVFEPANSPLGFSLQLSGQGSQYSDFSWSAPRLNTFGQTNSQQMFKMNTGNALQVNEPSSLSVLYLALLGFLFSFKKPKSNKLIVT